MGVTLVLSPERVDLDDVRETIRAVADRLGHPHILAPAAHLSHYCQLSSDTMQVGACDDVPDVTAADVVVFHRPTRHSTWGARSRTSPHARVYYALPDGSLSRRGPIDEYDWPAKERHAFARLSPPEGDCVFFNFPYGFLHRRTGMGDIDEFGFRIPRPIESYRDRPANHKLVAVFGGSATWGWYSSPGEAFPARLERMLAEACVAAGVDDTVTVLNFGQPSSVVFHQLITYLTFCDGLKPDCVIAHDGYNDFLLGMITDHRLLRATHLTYDWRLEHWSQALHGTGFRPTSQPGEVLEPRNLPQDIITAYVRRKLQFHDFVRARGIPFIWGLQPTAFSKSAIAIRESRLIQERTEPMFRKCLARLPFLYEQYERHLQLPARVERVVDLHSAFKRFNRTHVLFGDYVHPLPEGEAEIARSYCPVVAEALGVGPGPTDGGKG